MSWKFLSLESLNGVHAIRLHLILLMRSIYSWKGLLVVSCAMWPTMSEASRFGLVKSMVEIETKLTTAKLSKYGSIYYRNDHRMA
jgi:hypothetical protein